MCSYLAQDETVVTKTISPSELWTSFIQYQKCQQANCTMNEYTEKFYRLNAWLNFSKTKDQLIVRYIEGLKLVIQDRMALQGV